ncbi:filamentous hemagglutinin N-terminal domain-containing protein [Okeanomitos corallinicola TIOX110]|uniref:Filamentous hemagglutinin N-terminal domain-containing protein n=1 Tax=Okeanomitos corallinicola TIOX110 TaxID=3133117 RepID=A0ABZ2UQK3_9CYAN
MNKQKSLHFILYLPVLLLSIFSSKQATAQIIPDNTLPHNSQVQPGCLVCEINGGTVKNANLFHSFKEFSLPTNGQAIFNNGLEIQNIFTRVTGNNISKIDGLIRVNGSANLFFINPHGIIFGNNASLDIGGSFVGSTANRIKFLDGSEFSSQTHANTSLLTITTPIGLQFGNNPGTIQVQAKNGLEVQPNQTLALVGGDINFQGGTIKTNGGRLELGSVQTKGLVNITTTNQGFLLGYNNTNNFGDITLTSKSNINASGIGGGEMQMQSRNLRISEASRIASLTLGSLSGGNIKVNATDTIEMIGIGDFENKAEKVVNPMTDISQIEDGFFVLSIGSGSTGNLEINTNKLVLRNASVLLVSTLNNGNGGNLHINADESVELNESLLATGNRIQSSGNSGDLIVNTKNLILVNRGFLGSTALGTGKAGNIKINAAESIELTSGEFFTEDSNGISVNTNINSSTLQTADAGNIEINTQQLIVRENTVISASTLGFGNGGSLTINAEDIQIFGDAAENFGGLATASEINATGNGGNLIINAHNLQVQGGRISASTVGVGKAGDIKINTKNLQISDQAKITVEALGTGNAGNLNLVAESILMDNFSIISGNTRSNSTDISQEQASINLRSQNLIMRHGSKITTNATGDNVIGGNITIDVDVLAALENSDITANSIDFRGGNVMISSQGIIGTKFRDQLTSESDITATGASPDLSGSVQINQLSTDPNQGLIGLYSSVIDTNNQLAKGCNNSGKLADEENKFTIIGSGGLPSSPDDLFTGTNPLVDLVELVPIQEDNQNIKKVDVHKKLPLKIVEAQGWVRDEKGNIYLVSQGQEAFLQSPILSKNYCSIR